MMHKNDPITPGGGESRPEFDIPAGFLRVAGAFAVSLFLTSHLPPALVPAALHDLLIIAAVITATLAFLGREHPLAPALTRWDEAAILALIALVAGSVVDPQAATEALKQLTAVAPPSVDRGAS